MIIRFTPRSFISDSFISAFHPVIIATGVFLLIFLTFRENNYLSRVVRIQDDRAHQVIKTGPYRYIRHPMYLGIIFMIIFTPLALGSFYALIFSALIVFLFILRTYLEDQTLQKELPGYKEYTSKVRFRLFPGVW